jgi:hypothetical protein
LTEVAAAAVIAAPEKRFATALQHRFFLRLHMTAMLAATLIAGIATTRILAGAGVRILWIRYALAVIAAYAVFVTSVKLWLYYIGIWVVARRGKSSGVSDWLDGFDFSSGGSSSSSSSSPVELSRGGGKFGGGGATGQWGSAAVTSKTSSKSSSSSGGGGGIDLGDLMVVVLIIALVLAILAAFIWMIWAAPAILGEAAFNGLLAGALAKHAKRASQGSWIGSVIRSTRIPFAVILALAILLGWYAQHHCPAATRLVDAIGCARD